MPKSLPSLQKIAWRAIENGEKIALRFFDYLAPNGYSYKEHNETVTEADLATNGAIIRVLKQLTPDIPIISEEGADLKEEEAPETPFAWVLDPIDGTTNFIGRLPLWGISLALLRNGEPVVGAITLPSLKQKYHALFGEGAWMGRHRLHVSKTKSLKESLGLICYGYRKMDATKGVSILHAFTNKARAKRMLGTAVVEASWVAAGRADFSILQGVHAWDVASGALLVREAGGKVVNFKGEEWSSQDKDIVFSNPHILRSVLKTLN
ncbi:MAG: inositol monophosphatase family protein [Patescibacteria group bacterium]|nr:hypothetical protein [Patescibacteria group bacterium]MBU2509469.1 hypothetical protein [Patescibacteria group bacterium]